VAAATQWRAANANGVPDAERHQQWRGEAQAGGGANLQQLGQVASAAESGGLGGVISGLNQLVNGQVPSAQSAPQFIELNTTVVVRKGAVIRAKPAYNAAGDRHGQCRYAASGAGPHANKLWWQVQLQDGSIRCIIGRLRPDDGTLAHHDRRVEFDELGCGLRGRHLAVHQLVQPRNDPAESAALGGTRHLAELLQIGAAPA